VIRNTGAKKKHQIPNPLQMIYNVFDDIIQLRITLSFKEVAKILQQRENILKLLDDPMGRIEAVIANPKQSQNTSVVKLRGKFTHHDVFT